MLVAAMAVGWATWSGAAEQMATVGAVPSGLPSLKPPPFDPMLWLALLLGAIVGPACYFTEPLLQLLDLDAITHQKSLDYL